MCAGIDRAVAVVVVVVSGKGNNMVVAVVGGDVEECSGDHKELLEDGNC